jgi:hypothetical protein
MEKTKNHIPAFPDLNESITATRSEHLQLTRPETGKGVASN